LRAAKTEAKDKYSKGSISSPTSYETLSGSKVFAEVAGYSGEVDYQ